MIRGILGTVRDRARHHLLLRSLSFALWRAGLEFVPYYVYREDISNCRDSNLEPGLTETAVAVLSPEEVVQISLSPESEGLAEEKGRLLRDNCICYGLKQHDEILSYMWCDFQQCRSKLASFSLRDNEVYMFRAVTFSRYRGRNLAPFLRSQVYDRLREAGRTDLFSITEALNYPATRFKEKLNAKTVRLGLYLRLFRRYTWNLTLRRYSSDHFGQPRN